MHSGFSEMDTCKEALEFAKAAVASGEADSRNIKAKIKDYHKALEDIVAESKKEARDSDF